MAMKLPDAETMVEPRRRHPLEVTRDRLLASVDEHIEFFSPAEKKAVNDVVAVLFEIEHELREPWRTRRPT